MLESAVKMEIILLRGTPLTKMRADDVMLESQKVDIIASDILMKAGGVVGRSPLVVPGDANCLFYSLSVAMTGKYSSKEFRVRTSIEMVVNRETYTKMHKNTGIALVSPDYLKAMKDCAMDWAFSSAWTIGAAATVLKTKIVSIYPPVNGLLDKTIPILHRTFAPVREDKRRRPIYIMWTSAARPTTSRIWSPNHFVPLLVAKEPPTMSEQNNSYLEVDEDVFGENQARSAAMTSTPKRRVKFLSTVPTIIIDSYM
ncbi:vertnin-like [Dendronephthya gigantea]|uniref:vertnin-like n=1 Tax=Dendronephthya gigantea TaxID=151771 RepID=UPI00106D817F|nr:vertnin-like [Dendronephthya gigantea]